MDLEKILRTDFSQEARRKQETLNGLFETLENGNQIQKTERAYKVMSKRKITVVIAAVLTLLLSITAFAYGEKIYSSIIKELTIGEHATYYVHWIDDGRGNEVVNKREEPNSLDKRYTLTTSKEIARQNTMFDFKLPYYLPEGYNQITYKICNDEYGQPSPDCKYLDVVYKNENGDYIYGMLRYMDETTGFSTGAGRNAKKVDINGNEAIVCDQDLHIEIDGILYTFFNNTIGRDELVKMASSLE